MTGTPTIALIAAVAAVLGAFIGVVSAYVIAKRNLKKEVSLKMADYRLQWIDNLGNEFADFSAVAFQLSSATDQRIQDEAYYKSMFALSKVKMLMNTKDQDFGTLVQSMYDLIAKCDDWKDEGRSSKNAKEFHIMNSNLQNLQNGILKREWRKLKRHLEKDTITVSALTSDDRRPYLYRATD